MRGDHLRHEQVGMALVETTVAGAPSSRHPPSLAVPLDPCGAEAATTLGAVGVAPSRLIEGTVLVGADLERPLSLYADSVGLHLGYLLWLNGSVGPLASQTPICTGLMPSNVWATLKDG